MTENLTLSVVPQVASLIQINPEATVSRTVMQAETCRAVLFALGSLEVTSSRPAWPTW